MTVVLKNAAQLVGVCDANERCRRGAAMRSPGVIDNGSLVMSYGHIGADLLSLASLLRIPVYMHNVPEESIFRPSAWNAFGTANREGADFRACANFGPLYA